MKPKDEIIPRNKYWTKGRLIFSPNYFTQLILSILLKSTQTQYEHYIHHIKDNIFSILGLDPTVFVKMIS